MKKKKKRVMSNREAFADQTTDDPIQNGIGTEGMDPQLQNTEIQTRNTENLNDSALTRAYGTSKGEHASCW